MHAQGTGSPASRVFRVSSPSKIYVVFCFALRPKTSAYHHRMRDGPKRRTRNLDTDDARREDSNRWMLSKRLVVQYSTSS